MFILLGMFIFKNLYPQYNYIILIVMTYLFIAISSIILIKLAICIRHNKKYILLIPLFILNILYIPFYYNKFIEKKKSYYKYISCCLLFSIIGLCFCISKYENQPTVDLHKKVLSDDSLITALFPSTYNKCNYNEIYDLECTDESNNVLTMVVNYKKDEINFDKPETKLIEKYYEVLKNNNETLKDEEEFISFGINNKNIIQKKYTGTKDDLNYYFILSSIKYHNTDFMSLVIQVVDVNNYKKQEEILKDIILSISKAQ